MIKKISYERRAYESVDENSLSKDSQKTDENNKSCNKGLNKMIFLNLFNPLLHSVA